MSKAKVICLGEALIDFVPQTLGVGLKDVEGFTKAPGGAPANAAAAVATLGGRSVFVGKFAVDGFGDFLLRTLQDKGVDVSHTRRTEEAPTALAFVTLHADGEREFLFYRRPSADMLLTEQEIDPSWFDEHTLFHFGSISLGADPVKQATWKALQYAKEGGALIHYDPNLRPALWENEQRMKEAALSVIGHVDVVKMNEDELAFFAPGEGVEWIESLLAKGVQMVVVTLGKNGCKVYTRQGVETIGGFPVNAIDTTGAGDGFVGGLLYQWHATGVIRSTFDSYIKDREQIQSDFTFANAVGAVVSTRYGAISALPSLVEVESLIEKQRKGQL
jgi:fructokinase